MEQKFDTIVTLGGGFFPDGTLTNLSIQRLDATVELYYQGIASTVTTLGGIKSTYLPNAITYDMPCAQKSANYLISKGIADANIHKIEDGLDTIGEAIACRDNLPLLSVSRFLLVTSELHMPRAAWVFKTILHKECQFETYRVRCNGILIKEEEEKYLMTTREYFSNNPDCLEDTSNWHQKQEPLYKMFKEILDKFHPKGKESEAYCAVKD